MSSWVADQSATPKARVAETSVNEKINFEIEIEKSESLDAWSKHIAERSCIARPQSRGLIAEVASLRHTQKRN